MSTLRIARRLRRGRAEGARPRRSRVNDMVIWRLLGDPMTGPQRMLESACGRARLQRDKVDRALRIGAAFDTTASHRKIGRAAHAQYARHGKYPWDLLYLEARGADLAHVDDLGNNVAHIAFDAANLPLSRWLAAHRMDLCQAANHAGHTAYDMLFGEIGLYKLEPDESRAFRDMALSWLDSDALAACKRSAWKKAIEMLPSRTYLHDLGEHFEWFDRFANNAPDRPTFEPLLDALDIDSDIHREVQRLLEPRYAINEREEIACSTSDASTLRARGRL